MATSYSAALAAAELPPAAYVGLLRALRTLRATLDQALDQASDAAVIAVRAGLPSPLPALDAALAQLGAQDVEDLPVAAIAAELAAQQLRRRAYAEPLVLLGYLYVLDGPSVGWLLPPHLLTAARGLAEADGREALVAHIEAAAPDADARARVVSAAAEAYAGLAQVVAALYPIDARAGHDLVRALNPEAGAHAIPTDRRELRAALLAGERSQRQFPYYTLRYGERGAQFTRSDSAWLVTLADHTLDVVEQQILWLGRLLSARGMPQWLLEQHLLALYDELVAAVPERRADYATLRTVAASLHAMRNRALSDAAFDALDAAFAVAVGAEWDARLPQTGALLAAAVADERAGIGQAVRSVERWMLDPERFPPVWIAAVGHTIGEARAQAAAA